MKIVKLILFTLFGLFFVNAGLDKFFHYMPMPTDLPEAAKKVFGAFMQIPWLMPLVGVVELVAGALILFPKTRTLGALMLFPVMVGILAHNFTVAPAAAGIGIALVCLFINIAILFDNKQKIQHIF